MVIDQSGELSYIMNKAPSSSRANLTIGRLSGSGSASSSEMSSDSDSETASSKGAVRVGDGYQAVIPDYCLPKPAPSQYPEKAIKVWIPNEEVSDKKISEYVQIAKEKYRYNPEQALGILFWHGFDFECALSDLSNFLPYPDEWTMEDKALFEQAHQFYNKNFLKINTLLPDKKISSLIKYYYTKWKILKCGVVCRSCFVEKSKDGNINANGNNDEGYFEDENKVLPNGMTKMILDKKVLVEIAREREANISRKAVELLELDIADVIRKIREHKQQNASIKESLVEFPDLIGLNQNNNRSSSRWNDSDILIFTKAISEFGCDFKTIAEILGSKTENQIKMYYLANKDKFKDVMSKQNIENYMDEEMVVEESSEEPRQVVGRFGK
ncbi:REST corepressor 3 [Tyrophagus putrescentiae]|nr:REST corepressor 3 [Tyrophagus putrescentiae]